MNYEEKYKQALETVQEILNSGIDAIRIKTLKLRLQSAFPELQENNDKRIRKRIIDSLHGDVLELSEINEAVAWLENQKDACDREYVFRPLAGDTIEKAAEKAVELDGKVVLAFNGAYISVGNKTKDEIVAEYHNWVKKQGEKDFCIGCTNDKGCVTCENGNLKEIKAEHKMLDSDEVIAWLHDHIQVDEPKVEYSTDGQPLAESFLAHAKARCIAADEVVKQFKEDFGL